MKLRRNSNASSAVPCWRLLAVCAAPRLALLAFCLTFPLTIFAQLPEDNPGFLGLGGELDLPPAPDAVKGVVLNRITREPIARVLVTSTDDRYAVLTDDRGRFEFKFPPREKAPSAKPPQDDEQAAAVWEKWWQRNNRPGGLQAKKPGFLANDPVPITGSGGVAQVEILMEPEALVFGRVQVPDANASEKFRVLLYRQNFDGRQEQWSLSRTFTAWSSGEFRLYDLPAGTYKLLTVDRPEREVALLNPNGQLYGLPPVYFPNATDFSTAAPIQLSAGTRLEANLTPVRREYYPVKIAIANDSCPQPPQVQVYPQGRPGPGYLLEYLPRVHGLQGFLPDGSYTVKLTCHAEEEGSGGILNFSVRGGPSEGETVTLSPNATLSVLVKTAFRSDHEPFSVFGHPSVSLIPIQAYAGESRSYARHLPEDPPDVLTIRNVPQGEYWLSLDANGGAAGDAYLSSATWDGADVLRRPIVIGPDGASSPIEITLRDDGAEISGPVIKRPEATPISYVYLVPTGDTVGDARMVFNHLGADFKFEQVPPGTYRIFAFESRRPELSADAQVLKKYEGVGIDVTVATNQKERLSTPLKVVQEP